MRYLSNGVLDSTFDGDGRAVTSGEITYGYALAIQNDSRIVIAGNVWTGSKYDIAIVRWQPDGSLDNSFDGDGKRFVSASPDADIRGLALQPDGRIVVAGRAGNEFLVARLNATGSLDTAFDGDGMARPPTGSGSDRAYDVAIQADGKIVAIGSSYNGDSNDFLVRRFLTNAELDHLIVNRNRDSDRPTAVNVTDQLTTTEHDLGSGGKGLVRHKAIQQVFQ